MLKTSLLSLAAAGLLMTGFTALPSAPAEAGYYDVGYGGHGYRRHYRKRHYNRECHFEYRDVKIRYYDEHCYCYKHKYIQKKVKVCH